MEYPRWNDPHRRRNIKANYKDADFCPYYDIDLADFQYLVMKLKADERLTDAENDRYGMYVLTMCKISQESPKFRDKPRNEKEEILEQQYFEMLPGLKLFNPNKGKLYSYAYRIGYTSACHYYTMKIDDARRQDLIEEHCKQAYEDYCEDVNDHKVRTYFND